MAAPKNLNRLLGMEAERAIMTRCTVASSYPSNAPSLASLSGWHRTICDQAAHNHGHARLDLAQVSALRTGQLQTGDVAERSKASILAIEHEGSTPSFTAEQMGNRRRDQAPRSPRLQTLNNDRMVQRDQHGPRDVQSDGMTTFGASVAGERATRAASPSLPRRAAAGRWSDGLTSGRRFEPPDA